jgi:hypothetical protein
VPRPRPGTTPSDQAASVSSSARATVTARASASFFGPRGPDLACSAAQKAERILQARQGSDQRNESALDKDFTNFASALSAAAQKETDPARAKAITALASDYTALVESQSGAVQLPDMNTVENDGAAFQRACALSHNNIRGEAPGRALRTGIAGPESGITGQVQVVPLTVNAVGVVSLLVQVPWKPRLVELPAAMVAL